MKRNLTALALATVLLLSGCGGNDSGKTETASQPTQEAAPENTAPSDTPVQVPEESAEPDKTEDHVLSTLEASVDGGRVLTLCAIGKQRADMDQWGIREVRVYEGNTLLQTISVQEAIDADGVDGIDTLPQLIAQKLQKHKRVLLDPAQRPVIVENLSLIHI